MASYKELNARPATDFLNPDNFVTPSDGLPEAGYAQAQYEKGIRIANESTEVGVSADGTWYAEGRNGSFTSSHEGIGYHSCTTDLLKGFLAGPARVAVYRLGAGKTVIREAK